MMSHIHEECGVFGIVTPHAEPLAHTVYCGLFALQHRGQEGAGITVNDDGVFMTHKDLGLVDHVFSPQIMSTFPSGTMAIGHTRYGTTGGNQRRNCQPMEVNHQKGKLALVHNGNLSNAGKLRSVLEQRGAIFHTTSDTEIIAYIITQARLQTDSIEDAVRLAVPQLEGAFSLIVMSAQKMIAVRDPQGFRPLCIGTLPDGGYVLASESCALSAVGASFLRDVLPGEMIMLTPDGQMQSDRRYIGTAPKHVCIFEYIYFARPGRRFRSYGTKKGGYAPCGNASGRRRCCHRRSGFGAGCRARLCGDIRHSVWHWAYQEQVHRTHVYCALPERAHQQRPAEAEPDS